VLDQQDTDPVTRIEACGAIAVLRRYPAGHALSIADALVRAGLVCIEITLDSPEAVDVIARIAHAHPHALIGAGTVRTVDEVAVVAAAGAAFAASPVTSPPVVDAALAHGLVAMPGAATPTEIATAAGLGAQLVKVFPVRELGGPSYLRSVLPPLGAPAVVVTGGVTPDDAHEYVAAGARAVGVGGSVFGDRSAAVDADAVEATAGRLLSRLGTSGRAS
jgi:2-dehydro-3-deoxyphosphogluconate aldolase/(4S)-4-hydroxy-2-oxoglutarate aldolase